MSLPIDTGLAAIGPVALLSDGTMVFDGNGEEHNDELKQYNPYTGDLLNCIDEEYGLWGNAEVKVDGKSTLVLSDGYVINMNT